MLLKITQIQPGMSAKKKRPKFLWWKFCNWRTYCGNTKVVIYYYVPLELFYETKYEICAGSGPVRQFHEFLVLFTFLNFECLALGNVYHVGNIYTI